MVTGEGYASGITLRYIGRASLIAALSAVAAFLLRVIHRPGALAPFDELYHWKRIAYSVAHFPSLLDFDPDRGLAGAFCPWPPLYDLAAAVVALAFGAGGAGEVLSVIVWIPPVASALLVGTVAFIVSKHSLLSGALTGIGLSCAPFLVFHSSAGDIDHHFLEPFLVLAIAGATMLRRNAIALALAILAALMVQTALIVACGLAFACLFIAKRNASAAFAVAAFGIAVYRLTRPSGYPDNVWFLGWTHVALLALAAAALLLRTRVAFVAIAIAVAIAIPGLRFFAGDPWLTSIAEFQPVWKTPDLIGNYVAALGAGLIASLMLLRRRDPQFVLAIFSFAFIAATIPRRRFNSIATALAIVVAAILIPRLWEERKRALAILFVITVAVVPPIHLAIWFAGGVSSQRSGATPDFLRAAEFLRRTATNSRVLAPWSYGHMFDVIGDQRVVIDNFGSMPDRDLFERANEILTSTNADEVGDYFDRYEIRYLVTQNPRVERGFRRVGQFGEVVVLERLSARAATP